MRREIGVNSTPGCTFHPSLIAFISDALQGSWFGADKGQLRPFTRLHPLVGESGPEIRKRYWGRRFWARGYFCTTSGNVTDDINFIQYIQSHSDRSTDASR